MQLIHLPYKKEVRKLRRKLAEFLCIDECRIKFHRHTTTGELQVPPIYPQVANNVGYFTVKPLRKRKYTLFHEFLFKTNCTGVPQVAPTPKVKHVIPLYRIVVSGTAPNTTTTITPLSPLFFTLVDFMSKQCKTLWKLLHKLKRRNITYYSATSNTPALLSVANDLSGIPHIMAAASVNNTDTQLIVYKQKICPDYCKKVSCPDYAKLTTKLSKLIKRRVHNVVVTLSKKSDNEYNNVRITVCRDKDVDAVKNVLNNGSLLEDHEYTVSVNDKNQTVIKINVCDLVKFRSGKKCRKNRCKTSKSSCSSSSSSDSDCSSSSSSSSCSSSSDSDSSSSDSDCSSSSSSSSSSHSRKSHCSSSSSSSDSSSDSDCSDSSSSSSDSESSSSSSSSDSVCSDSSSSSSSSSHKKHKKYSKRRNNKC